MRSNKQTTDEMWRNFVAAAAVLSAVTIGAMMVTIGALIVMAMR